MDNQVEVIAIIEGYEPEPPPPPPPPAVEHASELLGPACPVPTFIRWRDRTIPVLWPDGFHRVQTGQMIKHHDLRWSVERVRWVPTTMGGRKILDARSAIYIRRNE